MKVFKMWYAVILLFLLCSAVLTGCGSSSVPDAPTGVSATPGAAVVGNSQATIAWTLVPGANSYNIYWSISQGVTPASLNKIAVITSPYLQVDLANGVTYYYVVTAVNGNGESAPSSETRCTAAEAPVIF
jgi:hypothetical protein